MTQTEIREMIVLGEAVVITVAELEKLKQDLGESQLRATHWAAKATEEAGENKPLRDQVQQLTAAFDRRTDILNNHIAREKVLEDALGKYADKDNWTDAGDPGFISLNLYMGDSVGYAGAAVALAAKTNTCLHQNFTQGKCDDCKQALAAKGPK